MEERLLNFCRLQPVKVVFTYTCRITNKYCFLVGMVDRASYRRDPAAGIPYYHISRGAGLVLNRWRLDTKNRWLEWSLITESALDNDLHRLPLHKSRPTAKQLSLKHHRVSSPAARGLRWVTRTVSTL